MLTFSNLSYCYHRGRTVLDDINATVGPGICLLLGENGAGKTTLLGLAGGALLARHGDVDFDGECVGDRLPSVMSDIFYLSDNWQSPFKDIYTTARFHGAFYPNLDLDMLAANLEAFGLTGREKLKSLSLGMRRKTYIAYALALRPKLLLFDEPANGLDITSRTKLLRMMARCVSENQTVIISTHTVWDFQNLFDGLLVLGHGSLLINMPIWEIARRVKFVHSFTPVEGAIYQEPDFGQFKAIVPNSDDNETTDVDFVVLYNALQSPASRNLVELLSAPES